jgi:hypothetical protein
MRTKVQLLKLSLKHSNEIETGLCHLFRTMWNAKTITYDEYELLNEILRANMTHSSSTYYFTRGKIRIRQLYLLKLIIKYTFKKISVTHVKRQPL